MSIDAEEKNNIAGIRKKFNDHDGTILGQENIWAVLESILTELDKLEARVVELERKIP